ncbi:MAG: GDYXXLXY domain-containing protein [Mesorhizobium sp.]|nr:GDYXXLXY domain-containing protein [Mesorhizobium sp.]MBL8578582.1 GDYXXLXY domain-containing protein [Mesorhizobium sp.]
MSGQRLVLAAVVLALVQIGFLSWIIMGRAAVLRNGQEVVLKVEPIDPRDLLRGDYVVLNYEIRNVPVAIVSNAPSDGDAARDTPIFVRLGKDDDGYWRARSASLRAPAGQPTAGEVDIRGIITSGPFGSELAYNVGYGIDRFYVPEGEGRAIETDMRERPFGVLAAIAQDGTAQIKALLDGQTPLYEEPLY